MKKFIFGLSAGRSGSSSLAYLLNSQPSAYVSHELSPILSWAIDRNAIQFKFNQLDHQSNLYDIVGDVAAYYLPYVDGMIQSLAVNLMGVYKFKFIVLKREDKDAFVRSYLTKLTKQNNNPFQSHAGSFKQRNEWDDAFPNYDNISLEQALSLFYDDYYRAAKELVDNYPNNVKIFSMDALNTEAGVKEILDFACIEHQNILVGIKKNQTGEDKNESIIRQRTR